jgi:hypothetical protein
VYASGILGRSTLLMEYSPARDRIALLLDPDSPATLEIEPTQLEDIVRTVDYAWLSDLKTTKFHTTATTLNLNADGAGMSLFEGFTPGAPLFPMDEADFNFTTLPFDTTSFYGLFDAI